MLQLPLNNDEFRNLIYNESSFIDDGKISVVCVMGVAEGVGVDEGVQAKFIKIVII